MSTGNPKIDAITVHDEERVLGFFGPYRFLSNFEVCPNYVYYENMKYTSTEAAYQAAKTLNLQEREKFTLLNPLDSKRAGRSLHFTEFMRPDWEEVKYGVMLEVVRDKFTRNKGLQKVLLETGDRYLEETNWWGDTYWGVCEGVGENNLGKVLMQVRSEIASKKQNEPLF